MPAGMEI